MGWSTARGRLFYAGPVPSCPAYGRPGAPQPANLGRVCPRRKMRTALFQGAKHPAVHFT